jgi:hypothetical protein
MNPMERREAVMGLSLNAANQSEIRRLDRKRERQGAGIPIQEAYFHMPQLESMDRNRAAGLSRSRGYLNSDSLKTTA